MVRVELDGETGASMERGQGLTRGLAGSRHWKLGRETTLYRRRAEWTGRTPEILRVVNISV